MSHILLEDVSLRFELQREKRIKDLLLRRKPSAEGMKSVEALQHIGLDLKNGDRLGIVGHNGAGKSTLLKLIAGIYPPTLGRLEVEGRIACLFEMATGFEMEATGWDNICLRGLMLGLKPEQIEAKAQEIADFSGLGRYLEMPVKYYSSGMFIRLAFSVSTSIEPDILLLDEVVAAGDAAFLEKAQQRMRDMVETVHILVFVSHSMQSIQDFCNKAVCLERGRIIQSGTPKEVCDFYIARAAHSTGDMM